MSLLRSVIVKSALLLISESLAVVLIVIRAVSLIVVAICEKNYVLQ